MLRAFGKALIFVAVFLTAGAVAISTFESSVAKHNGRSLLEQTAVIASAWRPHELNVTYGEGGSPESLKHNHTHNAQGFKYPKDTPKEKPEKTIRVFAMGGSTLYGWGSEDLRYGNWMHLANDETITHFLERALNREIKKTRPDWNVEVINAAVIDYNSAFHLVYYNQKIWEYHPDVVIFLDGNNEFFGIKPFNSFAEYRNSGVNVINGFVGRGKYFTMYVVARYFAQFSSFFRTLQNHALNSWIENEAPTVNDIYALPDSFDDFDAKYEARAQLFLRTYSQLKAAADFDGVKMALFLGPEMLLEDPSLLGERDLATRKVVLEDWIDPNDHVNRGDFMQRVRALLPGSFARIHMPYYDVSTLAAPENKNLALYIDYTHVTPLGAEVVAGKMFAPTLQLVQEVLAKH